MENLAEFLDQGSDDQANEVMNTPLGHTLMNIVFSTVRGIVLAKTSGTIFQKSLLPVLDAGQVFKFEQGQPFVAALTISVYLRLSLLLIAMRYNWELKDWPNFSFEDKFADENELFKKAAKELRQLLGGYPPAEVQELIGRLNADEILNSSLIEGESYQKADLHRALKKRLQKNEAHQVYFKTSTALSKLALFLPSSFVLALDDKEIFTIQALYLSDRNPSILGKWRNSHADMHIVSGQNGREKIHFSAPPARKVRREMTDFIDWYNKTAQLGAIEKAAIGHLYFESIHPLVDGNGRVGRYLMLKSLYRSLGYFSPINLSQAILENLDAYYSAFQKAQHSNELTAWISYFATIILRAQELAKSSIQLEFRRAALHRNFETILHPRQWKVLEKMFDSGEKGFTGGLTASKYMSMTKASKATATRDLQQLTELGILKPEYKGRSTCYQLAD